jgi:hypothetical protein
MNSLELRDSYFFSVLPVESGYQLRVNSGGKDYIWPSTYSTLETVGKEILRALTTASECRGEIPPHVINSQKQPPASRPTTVRGRAVTRPPERKDATGMQPNPLFSKGKAITLHSKGTNL